MLLIPVGIVENERTFSGMNIVKNDQRNRLNELHLNDAMRVRSCRWDLESFPMSDAINYWSTTEDRRGV